MLATVNAKSWHFKVTHLFPVIRAKHLQTLGELKLWLLQSWEHSVHILLKHEAWRRGRHCADATVIVLRDYILIWRSSFCNFKYFTSLQVICKFIKVKISQQRRSLFPLVWGVRRLMFRPYWKLKICEWQCKKKTKTWEHNNTEKL